MILKKGDKMKQVKFPRLRQIMKSRHDTVRSLALALYLTEPSLYNKLNGKSDWTLIDIYTICRRYGLHYEYLFHDYLPCRGEKK